MNISKRGFILVLLFCGLPGAAVAQTVGASLQGTIYDLSGGFVMGASVEIRSVDKGETQVVKTDDHGRYRQPLLMPGRYDVRVSMPGFQTVVKEAISLTVGLDAVVDFKLEIAQAREQVVVTGEAPAVNLISG